MTADRLTHVSATATRVLLVAWLASLASLAAGDSLAAQTGLRLRFGPSVATMSVKEVPRPGLPDWTDSRIGIHLEALWSVPLRSWVGMRTGVGLAQRGGSGDRVELSASYLQVPVLLALTLPVAEGASVELVTGMAGGLRVACDADLQRFYAAPGGCDNEGQVRGQDAEVVLGLGLDFGDFSVALQRHIGLVHVAEVTRTRAFSLLAGIDLDRGP